MHARVCGLKCAKGHTCVGGLMDGLPCESKQTCEEACLKSASLNKHITGMCVCVCVCVCGLKCAKKYASADSLASGLLWAHRHTCRQPLQSMEVQAGRAQHCVAHPAVSYLAYPPTHLICHMCVLAGVFSDTPHSPCVCVFVCVCVCLCVCVCVRVCVCARACSGSRAL